MIVSNTTFRMAPWADYLWGRDHDWHQAYGKEAGATFAGKICAPHVIRGAEYFKLTAGNSGAGAILLAAELGAKDILLLGYDCQHTNGAAHWHADHPVGMGNAGTFAKWPAQFDEVRAKLPPDVKVTNCTRSTALTTWPQRSLEDALRGDAPPVVIVGMHGMGDCLHQRAIVREYMHAGPVYLQTPWPELYHDLRGPRLKLLRPDTRLRTQAKNAARAEFDDESVGADQRRRDRLGHRGGQRRRAGADRPHVPRRSNQFVQQHVLLREPVFDPSHAPSPLIPF